MKPLTEKEFTDNVRSCRNVVIKSALIGGARLTSYYQGKSVIGLVREYRGVRTFYSNEG